MKLSDLEAAKELVEERGDLMALLASLGKGYGLQVTTTSCYAPTIDVADGAPLVGQVKAWAGDRIAAIELQLAALGVEIDVPKPELPEIPEPAADDAEAKAAAAAA